ncbi:PepSY domain-containing protein [Bdellovibrio sp. BCCA]|uniref:PepSY domain-containing protein n=1 Tax=unclassified Bdellovibrio TaxID=2633795 RepID=UPI0025FDB9F4|nr:PepSY domain-containing protein [uncultured Bdellovibrio sp.]
MKISRLLTTVLVSTLPFATVQAKDFTGSIKVDRFKTSDYASQAKVSMQDAINAAEKKVPGKAIEAELESEHGYLIYEIKVMKEDKKKAKLKVDAGNLAILSIDDHVLTE